MTESEILDFCSIRVWKDLKKESSDPLDNEVDLDIMLLTPVLNDL